MMTTVTTTSNGSQTKGRWQGRGLGLAFAGAALTAAAVALLALGGCSAAPRPAPQVLNAEAPGAEEREFVSVARGQLLSVRLPAEPEAGLQWRMRPSSSRNGLVALSERHTENDGAQTWNVFTFNALSTGRTEVEFFYDRLSDPEPPSQKRYTLSVQVMDARAMAQASAAAE